MSLLETNITVVTCVKIEYSTKTIASFSHSCQPSLANGERTLWGVFTHTAQQNINLEKLDWTGKHPVLTQPSTSTPL